MNLFLLSNKAKNDLGNIALFSYHRWGKEQRNIYIRQFDEAFGLLAKNPSIGIPCNNIQKDFYKFPQGSHLIFYKLIDKNSIHIIRILHKSVDVSAIIED
ncbi:type II toxin-antitoxin system RelE/ParE family toxin [Thalassotalea agarivorans]|uniref:Toxin n=1 Tax=Thalassotalea agarivorans TaxID=349064 RepID=A0A1I0GCA1_THASX|nr:type II toxin-antitoxin system RelE/ParE family toxin [Thalassotalea agarivorans]SET67831.1 toxin ParE1/3/4 [Thalassotalea agarivorans]